MTITIPVSQKRSAGIATSVTVTVSGGKTTGRQRPRPESEQRRRLQGQQDPERRASRANGDAVLSGRNTGARSARRRGSKAQGDDERRRRPERVDEEVGCQRADRVARDHRDRARREVDDSRAAIGQDDPEPDPGDQRAAPETKQCEQENLIHALPVSGAVAI